MSKPDPVDYFADLGTTSGGLKELLAAMERQRATINDAIGVPPEMLSGKAHLNEQRARRAGKTAEMFMGFDRASQRGEYSAFAIRDREGRLITITIPPGERVTRESLIARVQKALHDAAFQRCVAEGYTIRSRTEGELAKQGFRVVEGTVLARSSEKECTA